MARLYYRVKLEGLLAFRGVLKRVERFDDSPRVQNWYDKLTEGGVATSWELFLLEDDSQQLYSGAPGRIILDEENYLGVNNGKFARVQDENAIWYFLENPDDSSKAVYYTGGSYYWNWTQATGSQGYQVGLLQADQLDNETIRNYASDPNNKFCLKPLPDCSQSSYITLYDQQQQYIKLNKSSEEVLQVECRGNPPSCDDTDFLFNVESI